MCRVLQRQEKAQDERGVLREHEKGYLTERQSYLVGREATASVNGGQGVLLGTAIAAETEQAENAV